MALREVKGSGSMAVTLPLARESRNVSGTASGKGAWLWNCYGRGGFGYVAVALPVTRGYECTVVALL